MTNETTASQPKSIGDDAQFDYLRVLCEQSDCSEQKRERRQRLVDFIDSRAPAAQASATIQAAPEGYAIVPIKPTEEMENAYFKVIDKNMQRVMTDARFGRYDNFRAAYTAMVSVTHAATIHEPVMVAEPVGEVKTSEAANGELPELPKPTKQVRALFREDMHWTIPGEDYYTVSQMEEYARAAQLATSTTPAAQMVADPAGVVLESGCCPACSGSGHSIMLAGGGPDAEEHLADCVYCGGTGGLLDAYNGTRDLLAKAQQENVALVCRLAATVKAVPSEALELAGMVVKATFGEQKILVPRVDLSGKEIGTLVYFAAPLADKTGGGE